MTLTNLEMIAGIANLTSSLYVYEMHFISFGLSVFFVTAVYALCLLTSQYRGLALLVTCNSDSDIAWSLTDNKLGQIFDCLKLKCNGTILPWSRKVRDFVTTVTTVKSRTLRLHACIVIIICFHVREAATPRGG